MTNGNNRNLDRHLDNQTNDRNVSMLIKQDALVAHGISDSSASVTNQTQAIALQNFDQPLVLRQSPKWTNAILWTLIGSVTFGLVWAAVAKIEESIPAQQTRTTGSRQRSQSAR